MSKLKTLGFRVKPLNMQIAAPAPKPSKYGQGRGGRSWRRIRNEVMKRDAYLCQPCQRAGRITLATEVDHIVNLAHGGTDDSRNLQSICKPCHAVKTIAERTGGDQSV